MKKMFVILAVICGVFSMASCEKEAAAGTGFYGVWDFDDETPGDFEIKTKNGFVTLPKDVIGGEEDLVLTDVHLDGIIEIVFPLGDLSKDVRWELTEIQEDGYNTLLTSYTVDQKGTQKHDIVIKGMYTGQELKLEIPEETVGMLNLTLQVKEVNAENMVLVLDLEHFAEIVPDLLKILDPDGDFSQDTVDMIWAAVSEVTIFEYSFYLNRVK